MQSGWSSVIINCLSQNCSDGEEGEGELVHHKVSIVSIVIIPGGTI